MKKRAFGHIGLMLVTFLLSACSQTNNIQLVIKSKPHDAKVTETAAGYLGQTDLKTELNVEDRRYISLEVSKEGYKNSRISIDLENSSKSSGVENITSLFDPTKKLYTLDFFLTPIQSTLNVATSPSSAKTQLECATRTYDLTQPVDLDTDIFKNNVAKCELQVEKPGYHTYTKTITLRQYETNHLSVILKRIGMTFFLESTPQGANVYEKHLGFLCTTPCKHFVSGEKMDMISPLRDEQSELSTGISLKFTKEGYQDAEKNLWLNKAETQHIRVSLQQ